MLASICLLATSMLLRRHNHIDDARKRHSVEMCLFLLVLCYRGSDALSPGRDAIWAQEKTHTEIETCNMRDVTI